LVSLPERFHYLIPLILTWGEPDDSKRSTLLEESPNGALTELVRALAPEIDETNRYLNSLDSASWSEAASALGRLAECAAEAQVRLGRA
jgi:hypothetical protein